MRKFLKNVVNLFVKYLYSILWQLFNSRADFHLSRREYLAARDTSTISSFLCRISSNNRLSIVSNSEVRAPLSQVLVGAWKLCCIVSYYRNCLLKHAIERERGGRTEVTGRRRRRKQLLDDLKGPRGNCISKAEALDLTLWRTRFGRGCGPVIRQTVEWLSAWMNESYFKNASVFCSWFMHSFLRSFIHSLLTLSCDKSIVSSKASSPDSDI